MRSLLLGLGCCALLGAGCASATPAAQVPVNGSSGSAPAVQAEKPIAPGAPTISQAQRIQQLSSENAQLLQAVLVAGGALKPEWKTQVDLASSLAEQGDLDGAERALQELNAQLKAGN